MSAEEWIYYTYGGVSSDDLTDGFDDDALYAGESNNFNYERVSRPTHTHNPNNKKLPYISTHKVEIKSKSSEEVMTL